jgi:hypothetical protein
MLDVMLFAGHSTNLELNLWPGRVVYMYIGLDFDETTGWHP